MNNIEKKGCLDIELRFIIVDLEAFRLRYNQNLLIIVFTLFKSILIERNTI